MYSDVGEARDFGIQLDGVMDRVMNGFDAIVFSRVFVVKSVFSSHFDLHYAFDLYHSESCNSILVIIQPTITGFGWFLWRDVSVHVRHQSTVVAGRHHRRKRVAGLPAVSPRLPALEPLHPRPGRLGSCCV